MKYFENFQVGQVIELGSRQVTESEIIEFASEYDPQPFHLDHAKGKASLFGGLAASGWHTGSMLMRMLVDTVLNDADSKGSPGIDNLRWYKPVFPGDTLTARMTILETRPSNSRPNIGIIRYRCEVTNQDGTVVMGLVVTNFFGRKPAAV
ncbi:MAG: Acyl dehydratase [Chloroflexi bacterium]|jgi:acyl dehydratase|nr:Acyl dehydratase [Chloroflexota bacterium]